MNIQPVIQLETPAYPTEEDLPVAEITFEETLPERWQKAKGLAGALTLFLAANLSGGCGSAANNQSVPPPSPPQAQFDWLSTNRSQTQYNWPLPANPSPSPDFAHASEWVESIFANKNSFSAGITAGFTITKTPQPKEEDLKKAIQDNRQ